MGPDPYPYPGGRGGKSPEAGEGRAGEENHTYPLRHPSFTK